MWNGSSLIWGVILHNVQNEFIDICICTMYYHGNLILLFFGDCKMAKVINSCLELKFRST